MVTPSQIFEGSRHCICKEDDSLGVYVANFQDDELNNSLLKPK